MLALVLSLLGQSFLAQTHQHFDKRFVASALVKPSSVGTGHNAPADRDGDCPICLEIGHLGWFLLPQSQTLPIMLAVAYRAGLPPVLQPIWEKRCLLPRSRGPPRGFLN